MFEFLQKCMTIHIIFEIDVILEIVILFLIHNLSHKEAEVAINNSPST